MKDLTKQQLDDYYYGYNLRLADELGQFNKCIKQPINLEEKVELCNNLKKQLIDELHGDSVLTKQKRERRLFEEIFNEEMHGQEKELYPSY